MSSSSSSFRLLLLSLWLTLSWNSVVCAALQYENNNDNNNKQQHSLSFRQGQRRHVRQQEEDATDQSSSLDLYNIQPFAVYIASSSLDNSGGSDASASLAYALQSITELYLLQFFDATIVHELEEVETTSSNELLASTLAHVERVDLTVSLDSTTTNGGVDSDADTASGSSDSSSLVAHMYGSAAFRAATADSASPTTESENKKASRQEVQAYLQYLIDRAFAPPTNMDIYKRRLQASGEPYLANISTLTVTTSWNNDSNNNDDNNVDESSSSTSTNDDDSDWSAMQISFLTVLFVLLFAGMFVLFIKMRRVYSIHAHGDDYMKEQQHKQQRRQLQLDSSGAPPPQPPTTAHLDEVYGSHTLAHHYSRQQSRRQYYNQEGGQEATSFLQRFYQLAFSASQNGGDVNYHDSDHAANVDAATAVIVSDDDGYGRAAARHRHPHMYASGVVGAGTATAQFGHHDEDEEDAVDHHIHRSGPYLHTKGGTLASWVRSISASLVQHNTRNYDDDGAQQEVQFMVEQQHNGKLSKPFVYRDFPRHDGTPCLIYDNGTPLQGDSSLHQHQDFASTIWATSASSSSPSPSPLSSKSSNSNSYHSTPKDDDNDDDEEPVDSFVDRLEQLMVVRHEQYQERCNMEWQKDRRRRKQQEQQHQSLSPPSSSSSYTMPTDSHGQQRGILSVEQAEAALDDFLDVNLSGEEEHTSEGRRRGVAMVSPTTSSSRANDDVMLLSTPSPHKSKKNGNNNNTSTLSYDHVLTDEKQIDDVMRAAQHQQQQQSRRLVSWDEEDPTITGVMT